MLRFLLAVPKMGPFAVRGLATRSCHFAGSFDDGPAPVSLLRRPQSVSLPTQSRRSRRRSHVPADCGVVEASCTDGSGTPSNANTRRTGNCVPLGPGGYARRSSAASCVENSSTSLAESFVSSGGSTVHRSQSSSALRSPCQSGSLPWRSHLGSPNAIRHGGHASMSWRPLTSYRSWTAEQ